VRLEVLGRVELETFPLEGEDLVGSSHLESMQLVEFAML
jgi:hypothetical protein